MPVSSVTDIWNLVCDECLKIITQVAFDCFIADLKPVSFNSGELIISCKEEYEREIVADNYTEILQQSAKNAMGFPVKITFIIEKEESSILRAEEFSDGLSFEDFFTFQNFVVGSNNRFAHAASLAVADNPAVNSNYNPLVIYGPSGVGKTHLMLAIKNHIKKTSPYKKIEYIRSEDFTNQLINALQEGKLGIGTIEDFRNKFRNADVLLIDDIHFIAGKEQTQEEFFNTFNTLIQNNKQIVVTVDRPPKDIKTLDDRIRSRLEGGLFADILAPDFETRVGIILKKAEQYGIEISEHIAFYIAENIKVNTRQLEGVVKKIQAYISIQNKVPTVSAVQGIIKDIISDTKPEPIKVETIISEVAHTYNISESDILSNRKTADLVLARQVAMYIARHTTDLSFKAIGEAFGKDHTTVLYNVNKIEEFLKDKPYQKELVDDLIKNLRTRSENSFN
ncbi:MAG: chromosomal replication initiator protein DnaA [Clostridia bacterium]|nr:chromosomal replication initiator protein DnaA [Clostridia bacterium]